jgi:protein SCO1/2
MLRVRLLCSLALIGVIAIGVVTFARVEAARGPVAPDFTLTDQDGHRYTLSAHGGRERALFFGYTHCPDVCPTTLAALARAKRDLGAAGRTIDVIFVTVDPQRDTPQTLKRYVRLFDPSFVGLTGTQAELDPVLAAYHVYHQVLPAHGASGYLVAHGSSIDFIDASGRIRETGDWSDSPAELAHTMKKSLS